MDDDGFYYVRTWGWGCVPKGLSWSHDWGEQFLMETQRANLDCLPTWGHRPQAVPQSFRVQGCCWSPCWSCLTCLSSPGEAEWTTGTVSINFLEGPGPEAGGSRQGLGQRHPRARSVKTWAPGLAVGSLCSLWEGCSCVRGQVPQCPGGLCPWPRGNPARVAPPPPPSSMCPSAWWGEA